MGSVAAILAAPTLLDIVMTPVTSVSPWLRVSRIRYPPGRARVPGLVSIGVLGLYFPLSSAAAMVKGFIVEPGSITSVSARLRRLATSAPESALGL